MRKIIVGLALALGIMAAGSVAASAAPTLNGFPAARSQHGNIVQADYYYDHHHYPHRHWVHHHWHYY